MKISKPYISMFMVVGTLLFLFYLFFIKQTDRENPFNNVSISKIAQTIPRVFRFQTDNENIELNPVAPLTYEEEQVIPRKLNVLSNDENIATTLHYVDPPKILNIPQAGWEPICFRSINRLSKMASWPPLREVGVPAGSLEIRIWMSGYMEQGLRLYHYKGKWTGLYTELFYNPNRFIRDGDEWKVERSDGRISRTVAVLSVTPQTNWENLWKKVEALGILTLPDSSTLPYDRLMPGAEGYVVEINDGVQYRTYMYYNPHHQEWPEETKMSQILKTLRQEFIQSLPKERLSW